MSKSLGDYIKERHKRGEEATSATGSNGIISSKDLSSRAENDASQPKTLGDYIKARSNREKTTKDTSGVQNWVKTSNLVLTEISKYYNQYQDDNGDRYNMYDKALSDLLSSASKYRNEFAGDTDAVASIDQIADTLSKTQTYIKEANKRNKQWKGTESYNTAMNRLEEADKINTLYGMSTQEIEAAQLEAQGIGTEELETLQAKKNSLEQKANAYSFSRGVTLEQKKAVQNELAQVNNAIQSAEQKSAIAYTTMDGQNITWDALYRRKQKEENYAEFSKRDDWAENSTYKSTVPDENADYNDFSQPTVDWDYEEMNNPETFSHLRGGSTYRSEHMTKEEMEMFNYIYHTQGRDAAFDWQRGLAEDLETLRVQDIAAKTKEFASKSPLHGAASWVGARLTSPLAGAEYVGDLVDNLFVPEKSMRNTAAARNAAVDSAITEQVDWNIGKWDAFDFGYGTVTSAVDSALASLLPGGEVVLGLSAAASATNAALDRGMDEKSAVKAGIAAGVAESVFEHLSIGQFKKLQMIDPKSPKDFIFNTIKSMGVNASEEAATEIANSVYDIYVNGEFSDYETNVRMMVQSGMTPEEARAEAKKALGKQIAEAAASGALMGFGFGATGSAIGYNSGLKQTGKEARSADGFELQGLANESLQLNPDNKLAQRVLDKGKASDRQIGKLVRSNEDARHAADVENTRQAVTARLTELKATENVEAVADVITKYVTGEKLTKAEQELIRRNRFAPQVAQEIREQKRAEEYMRIVEAAQIAPETQETESDAVLDPNENIAQISDLAAESPVSNKKSGGFLNEDAENATVEAADVNERKTLLRAGDAFEEVELDETHPISAINNGKMVLRLADGRNVSADSITHSSASVARVYDTVQKIAPDAKTANVIVNGFKDSALSAEAYSRAVNLFNMYGNKGYDVADLLKSGSTAKLSADVRNAAYKAGKITAGREVAIKQAAVNAKRVPKGPGKGGRVLFTSGTEVVGGLRDYLKSEGRTLTDLREAGVLAMEKMAEALGTDFYVFESYLKNGELMYLDPDTGTEKKAPNGQYSANGRIYVDLNAGNSGSGLMLYTAAHELTHHIAEWSPAKFKTLANYVVQEYGKRGQSVDELVADQMEKNPDLTYDEAFEEVVADSMESILADGNVLQMVAEIKKQDVSLAEKIVEWFKDLAEKLKSIVAQYAGRSPDSAEGKMVAEMQDVIGQIEKLYAEALVDAAETYNATFTAEESQTLTEAGIGFDEETKSVYSLRFSTAYRDEIQVGKKTFDTEAIAQIVAKGTGRSIEDARKWVKSEMTIANIVMENPEFLDFDVDNRYEAIKKNSDYPQGTVDLSNLCPKREEFTAMFDMLQKKYPNKLFTAQDIADMRKILAKNDITVACGACFVEDRRQLIGEIADTFIGMWKEAVDTGKPLQKTNAAGNKSELLVTKALAKQYGLTAGAKIMAGDTYIPNQYDLTTYEGFKLLEKNHPIIAMAFNRYNNSRGQQSARLIEGRAEYNRQILGWTDAKVRNVNNNGGLRIFSFSDFEVVHLLDLVQVIIDCSARGVKIQGYTKIPAFAKLVRDTGIKLNRSLIPKGDYGFHMENGKVVLDYDNVEGINIEDENFIDESDNPNVGNILIGINPTQIGAAMLDPFVDYIIPFHSNKAKAILKKLGTGEWVNYKESQHEKDISTGTASKHNVNIYTQVINKYHPKNKVEFVEAFLKECKRQGKIPRYAEFLNVDANGDYTYREGYHKLLVDFKMFDKDGNILLQGDITPNLNEDFMKELLNAEVDKKKNYQFPRDVYNAIEQQFGEKESVKVKESGSRYSLRDMKIPTREELNAKDPIKVVDISKPQTTGTYAERRQQIKQKAKEIISKPYLNMDTDTMIFLTEKSYTHAFNNVGDIQLNAAEHLPEFIENAVLTHAEPPEYGNDHTDAVYTFFAAARAKNMLPVKLKVKEYRYEGQMLPKNIQAYFESHPEDFAAMYDTVVLEVEEIKEDTSGSVRDIAKSDSAPDPNMSSDIKVADLLDLVKGDAEKYIPKPSSKYSARDSESVSNRSLLANAFESVAQDEFERGKIAEYRAAIDGLNEQEQKLQKLNAEIKQLSFSKGARDTERLEKLRTEAKKTVNRINTLDGKLLRLEAAKPLQDVLKREKTKAYKRAEQKGREALDALRTDMREKSQQKQRELTQRYQEQRRTAVAKVRETAEKREAREKLQKLVLDTSKWISYPAKTDVKCPDVLKAPYAEFLKSIDLSSKRLAEGGDPTKNDLKLANAMDSLATALDRLMATQDPSQSGDAAVLDAGYLDLPAGFVQRLRDMTENIKGIMKSSDGYVVNNMTAAEVRQVSQMIRTLNHAIKEMSTLYANQRFANVEEIGYNSMEYMDGLGEVKNTSDFKNFVTWDNALPFYAFKRFGEAGRAIFEGLMDAQDKLAFLAGDIFQFRDRTWKEAEAKKWSEDVHTIELPSGGELRVTTADVMSIYCLSRRPQGRQHLLGGGVRVVGFEKGSKKAQDTRSTLTIEDLAKIISTLTDRQRTVAEAMQEFMSTTCSEWGNEISMKRFLTKEFNEKYYFPIESNDENMPTKDPSAQQSDLFRLLNISATKPIDPRANNELIVRNIFDVFTRHTSDMARLNAFGMPLLDYMKWLNYREKTTNDDGQVHVRGVRKSMEKAYGNAAKSYVLNLIKDVNGRPSDGGDPTWLMKWMRAAKTASVGNSLRVATLQVTSYPRAALVLSQKSLALGLTKKPNINKAKKYCGIALWKSFGFYDTNISRTLEEQMKGTTNFKQKLIELSLKGAELGDAMTWGFLWNACEYEVAATKQYKVGSEEFNKAVGLKLREVVYRTQVVDSTLTRSQIMRSKKGLAQEAAAFMSEPTLSGNILMDAGFEFASEKRRSGSASKAWKKSGKYIGTAAGVYFIGQLTAALLESFWDAWRDDDGEEFGEKYKDSLIENIIMDLAPFNKIPVVSDIFSAAMSVLGIGYYSSDKMSTTWIGQAVDAVAAWKKVFEGGTSTTAYNAIYKSVRSASSFYGVSFSGILREGVALWNNTAGAYDSTLKIRQYEPTKADLGKALYKAITEGDEQQAESIRNEFREKTEDEAEYKSSVSSALHKALRENDERIHEAAAARFNGDFDRYKELFYEIKNEGNFSFDDIMSAVNAEVNALEKAADDGTTGYEAPEWENDKESVHNVENYYKAVISDNTSAASKIKADLIEELKGEGYLTHEAESNLESSFTSKVKEAYMDGTINRSKAETLLVSYGGKTDSTEADSEIEKWNFELDQGYSWGARARGYRLGRVSEKDLVDAVMAVEGVDIDEAYAYIDFLDLEMANDGVDISVSDASGYYKYAEPAGISVDVYMDYKGRASACTGQKDENGKTISGSKKAEVLAVIDSLPISSDQKDALYYANGWAESKINEAPWR